MNHTRYEDWVCYVENKLDEEMRSQYEEHLYNCDHCLELYLHAVERCEQGLPEMQDEQSFTDHVMNAVAIQSRPETKQAKRGKSTSPRREKILHYVLAAAVTLILMSTGTFSQLMNVAGALEKAEVRQEESIVYALLNKPISITDKLEDYYKEGDQK